MRQDDQVRAQKLAFVNSVSENAYDIQHVCIELLKLLQQKYPAQTREYYNISPEKELSVENIAISRNWIVKGGALDIQRTAVFVLSDFRCGKIGRFILDEYSF